MVDSKASFFSYTETEEEVSLVCLSAKRLFVSLVVLPHPSPFAILSSQVLPLIGADCSCVAS